MEQKPPWTNASCYQRSFGAQDVADVCGVKPTTVHQNVWRGGQFPRPTRVDRKDRWTPAAI
jgi:hypothetical protein